MARPHKDITNYSKNNLTAIEYCYSKNGKPFWKFKCSCEENQFIICNAWSVIREITKSCGCLRKMAKYKSHDITGIKYNKLLAIKFAYRKKQHESWEFKCDCGNIKIIAKNTVKQGRQKSCGDCPRTEKGLAGFKTLIKRYQNNAKIRDLIWSLTNEECFYIFKQNCYYCNEPPMQKCVAYATHLKHKEHHLFLYNGIDRKDSNIGYTIENVVTCCKQCNYSKRSFSVEEFKRYIKKVYKNLYEI